MIIKMRSIEKTQFNVGSKESGAFASWVYFDGFRKVRIKWVQAKTLVKESYLYDFCNMSEQTDNESRVALLICRNKPGDEFTIATTESTYLLNDGGKTIEKLI